VALANPTPQSVGMHPFALVVMCRISYALSLELQRPLLTTLGEAEQSGRRGASEAHKGAEAYGV
jgi:hypothetical protein